MLLKKMDSNLIIHQQMDGIRYYFAGVTDATEEAKAVRCDVAFLPIGGTYTTDAKEAAKLANEIRPAVAVPMHYGSIVGKPQDAEANGFIGIRGYLNYFQDMATYYMHNLGKGNDTLPEEYGICFMYTKYRMHLVKQADYTKPLHMETWLEKNNSPALFYQGFTIERDGAADWIRMFIKTPFIGMPVAQKESIITEAVEKIRPVLFTNDGWIIDYVRIRVRARKR